MSSVSDKEVLSILRELDPYEFEEFVAALWELQGWDTEVTHGSGDRGIDVIATQTFPFKSTVHIQAKRYAEDSQVSGPEMQKYVSLTQRPEVDLAIVVTTGSFTQQATSLAEEFNIKLLNGTTLVEFIRELGAEELLVDSIDQSGTPDISDGRTTTVNPQKKQSASQPSSTVASGDWLRIELVGASIMNGKISGGFGGGNIEEVLSTEIDGLILAFEIANMSEENWEFRSHNLNNDLGFTAYDDQGFGYTSVDNFSPTTKGKEMGGGWKWNRTTIRAKSRDRVASYWEVSSDTEVYSVEYEEDIWRATDNKKYRREERGQETIRLQFNKPVRTVVGDIPEPIQNSIQ